MNKFTYYFLFLIFFTLSFSTNLFSQEVEVIQDSVTFKLEKSKKVNRRMNPSLVAVLDKRFKQVRIKVKMTPLYSKKVFFDPNKFSLVSEPLKARYRPTDVFFKNFTDIWTFTRCTSKKPRKENRGNALYTPDLEDSFSDYSYKDFKNVDYLVNLGSRKKPDIHVIYFKPREINERLLQLFVAIPSVLKKADLYYGDVKIGEVNFK
ncbi:hypothetical protein [uncultured Dokdonia sp.]|uniref:hypothetical protein n=1 Tax=uncultured Dokdonia sp. TaxID=575653 RepID=UPI0026302E85|nr:hypothetical protein [uncultured Dokdonia sp.]